VEQATMAKHIRWFEKRNFDAVFTVIRGQVGLRPWRSG